MSFQKCGDDFGPKPATATLLPGPLGAPLRFEVRADGAVWRFDVAFDGERPALHHHELVDDGQPDGHVRVGGYLPSPPVAAQLAIEAEMRRLWEDNYDQYRGGRILLTSAGFPGPPAERKSTAGRPRTSTHVLLAVQTRRALNQPQRATIRRQARVRAAAAEEKFITRARQAGILIARPRPHTFTLYGVLLLRQADRAKVRLLELLDERGGRVDVEEFAPRIAGPPDAKRAALDDLEKSSQIEVTRWASPDERKRHGYDEAEIARLS